MAEYLNLLGSLDSLHYTRIVKGSITGNTKIQGDLKLSSFQAKGSVTVEGRIFIEKKATFFKPVICKMGIQGDDFSYKADLTFYQSIQSPEIKFCNSLILFDVIKCENIEHVRNLTISGSIFIDNILLLNDCLIDLQNRSQINKIKCSDLEIGKSLNTNPNRDFRRPYFKNSAIGRHPLGA